MSIKRWLLLPVLVESRVSDGGEGATQRTCTLRQVQLEIPFLNVRLHCLDQIRIFMLSISVQRQGPNTYGMCS